MQIIPASLSNFVQLTVLISVKIKRRFICIPTHALLRVNSKEQFITAFKLNTGVAKCLGYGGTLSFYHTGKPFYKGNEIGTSLPVAVQLVPSDTR